jgi:hypothetical protein
VQPQNENKNCVRLPFANITVAALLFENCSFTFVRISNNQYLTDESPDEKQLLCLSNKFYEHTFYLSFLGFAPACQELGVTN